MRIRLLAVAVVLALPAPAAAATLVQYSRTGGFTGESTSLVVKRDRHASVSSSRQGDRKFTLSRKRYRSLRAALRAARFATLDREYGTTMVADGIDESVTFKGITVVIHTDGDPPARLDKALAKVRDLAGGPGSAGDGAGDGPRHP